MFCVLSGSTSSYCGNWSAIVAVWTNGKTYISKDDAPFAEDFGLVVVVDAEPGEEDLVLVGRECALISCQLPELGVEEVYVGGYLERLFGLRPIHAPELDERPKGCVVEVVDVAWYISVSPRSDRFGLTPHSQPAANSGSPGDSGRWDSILLGRRSWARGGTVVILESMLTRDEHSMR